MSVYDFYITDEEYAKALRNGISYDTLNTRVRALGWEKKKAINSPVKKYKKKRNKYGVWRNVAINNGIAYTTFVSRVENGMEIEKAATKPPKCKRKWAEDMRERRMKKIELREVSKGQGNEIDHIGV